MGDGLYCVGWNVGECPPSNSSSRMNASWPLMSRSKFSAIKRRRSASSFAVPSTAFASLITSDSGSSVSGFLIPSRSSLRCAADFLGLNIRLGSRRLGEYTAATGAATSPPSYRMAAYSKLSSSSSSRDKISGSLRTTTPSISDPISSSSSASSVSSFKSSSSFKSFKSSASFARSSANRVASSSADLDVWCNSPVSSSTEDSGSGKGSRSGDMSRSSSISARRTGSAGAASSSSDCLPIDSSSSARLTFDAILRPTPPLCIACILTAAACLSASAAAVSTSVFASSSTSSSSTDWSTAAASTMRSTTASTSPSNASDPPSPEDASLLRASASFLAALPR